MKDKIKSFFRFGWIKKIINFVKAHFKWFISSVICLAIIAATVVVTVFFVSLSVKASTAKNIIELGRNDMPDDVDYIIVLGAGLRSDGTPSDMLADRLAVGITLLIEYPDAKLLLTGDNSGEHII